MRSLKERRDQAEAILAPYFPDGSRPFPLLKQIIFALGDAQMHGYDERLRIMEPHRNRSENCNDN